MIIHTAKQRYCGFCHQVTEVVYHQGEMHVENICPNCQKRRRRNPFISRKKLNKIIENLPSRGNYYDKKEII